MLPPSAGRLASSLSSAEPLSASNLIFLIGYRGTGKSTVARLLAARIGWSWVDADEAVEASAGLTIRDIFAREGEEGFRAREAAMLAELCERRRQVIATGGGVVLRADNRERLRGGRVVWLTADAATLWQRVQLDPATADRRPPLSGGGPGEIEELLARREPLYRACANLTVATAGRSPDAAVADIIAHLQQD
jgi:shikimate kinase